MTVTESCPAHGKCENRTERAGKPQRVNQPRRASVLETSATTHLNRGTLRFSSTATTMSTDILIKSFTHLTGRPKADQAMQMLRKVASMVKPIMRTHQWILPTLAEFFPDQSNLLGALASFVDTLK